MIKFYFSESIKSITRAKLASFIAIISLSISILFIASSFALIFLSNKIENSWKSEIKINLFINDSVNSNQLSKVKASILEFKEVAEVKFISKQDAYKNFVEMTGEDFSKILDENPLPRSYTISFKNSIN
ncbi:MAG: permease-like cell division protein FtsX, partial [Bacteroidetes bacterium]|nr:permease-like cell division protein FtsX [Bacteroidota bacterium]